MLITIYFLLELIFYLIFYYIIIFEKHKRQGENIELVIEEVNDNSSSNSNASKKKENNIWNYFNKYKDNNSILRAKCYYYDKDIYNMNSLNSSTGNLIKHFKLHSDKTNPSTKKQIHFMVKFLNDDL